MAEGICLFHCSVDQGVVTAQDCSQAASLQLLGQRLNSFPLTSSLPFLAFGSHWVLGSIWLLSVCVLDDRPGTSPLNELPLALSSHSVRFVTLGHNSLWGLSVKSDTSIKFSCCPHASCHRHKTECALASIHLQQGGRACWNPLLHTKTPTLLPVWQLCGWSLLGQWWS